MGEASEGSSRNPKLGVYLQSPVKPFNFVKKKYGDAFPYRLSDTTIAVGLQNIGNTCWFHSAVQALAYSNEGWEAFKRDMSVLAFFEKYLDDPLKAASTTAAVPRVRVTRPNGTLLALAEERGRQGEAVTLHVHELTEEGRQHPAFTQLDSVNLTMELLEKINNSKVEPREELHVVESLVGKKRMKGQIHYQVKWQSYPPEFNTWKPYKNLVKWLGKSIIQEPAKNHTDQVVGAEAGMLTRYNGGYSWGD
ncbi:hypothetical protein Bbelb_406790 [Branchiostoma belcheri]|nr:hypothetical protein Bbelb_406790 [Branchiostoma belcheri]